MKPSNHLSRPVGRWSFALAVLLLAGCQGSSRPAAYPDRPIKLIVPFSAGGGTDAFARIIKKAIDDNGLLPQPLVIINIDGAGATVGSRRAKDAEPDGYTVLLLHDAILTGKASGKVNYGPEAFAPIAGTGEVGMVITVRADSPYQSLEQLMTAARDQPDSIAFGANMGALTHFAGLRLEKELPLAKFRYVQSGSGAKRFAEMKGGHIDVTGFSIEEFARFRGDDLRGLAYFGPTRHAAAADVPTARELGYEINFLNTFYWWAPLGTPPERIEVLAAALKSAMQTEFVRGKMKEIHCEPSFFQGAELQRRIAQSNQNYVGLAAEGDLQLPNVPVWCAVLVLGLTAAVGIQQIRRPGSRVTGSRSATGGKPAAATVPGGRRAALLLVVLTVAYAASLASGWVGYRVSTIGFLVAAGATLSPGGRREWLRLLILSVAAGLALDYVFRIAFAVTLP